VKNLKSKDIITIEFPMVDRTETLIAHPSGKLSTTKALPPQKFLARHVLRFRGNTLIKSDPPMIAPCYQDRPEKYKATKAPLKKVSRYVTDKILVW
jgi:hypothetical protein